jgi:hypothetical protein
MSKQITKTVDILYTYSTPNKSMSIEVDGLTTYLRIDGQIEASWPTASNEFIMNVLNRHYNEQNIA